MSMILTLSTWEGWKGVGRGGTGGAVVGVRFREGVGRGTGGAVVGVRFREGV